MKIFEFDDYKLIIRQFIKSLPSGGRGQVKLMAEHLGVHTTLMSQVISGPKDLTLEQAHKCCSYLSLRNLEVDYFLILVQISRAGTHELKKYYSNKKQELKKEALQISKRIQVEKKLGEQERSIFYSSRLFSAVHLYCSNQSGRTLSEIIDRLKLSTNQAVDTLRFLADCGLCESRDAKYFATVLSTHVDKKSPHLIKHHSNWRIKAIQRSENLTEEELMFTGNISLSRSDFLKIREILMQTIKQISEEVAASPGEDIANLNIDLFFIQN